MFCPYLICVSIHIDASRPAVPMCRALQLELHLLPLLQCTTPPRISFCPWARPPRCRKYHRVRGGSLYDVNLVQDAGLTNGTWVGYRTVHHTWNTCGATYPQLRILGYVIQVRQLMVQAPMAISSVMHLLPNGHPSAALCGTAGPAQRHRPVRTIQVILPSVS